MVLWPSVTKTSPFIHYGQALVTAQLIHPMDNHTTKGISYCCRDTRGDFLEKIYVKLFWWKELGVGHSQQKAQNSCWLCGSQTLCLGSDLVSVSLSLCLSQCQLVLEDWSPLPFQSHCGACIPPKQMACAAVSLPSVQFLQHIWKTYIWISFILT